MTDEVMENLIVEIISQAVKDWRLLCKTGKETNSLNFTELESFFKSPWCAEMLTGKDLTPERILEQLQSERKAAQKKRDEKKPKESKLEYIRTGTNWRATV